MTVKAIVVEGAAFGESMAGPRAVLDVSGNILEHRRVKPVPRTFDTPARRGPFGMPSKELSEERLKAKQPSGSAVSSMAL